MAPEDVEVETSAAPSERPRPQIARVEPAESDELQVSVPIESRDAKDDDEKLLIFYM